MTDVVSVKFKNRGKCYYFGPNGLDIKTGDRLIVETAKGLEMADCVRGAHAVTDTAVVQPLRPVVRVATADDLRIAEINKRRESEAFRICQKKIADHGLEMKLVDVECSFDGGKITFFFTADGRVDFRELVKDLAGVFRSRIELRQIGVRDEAKMLGGIAICGRPFCCSQFLDDFQPVSTKMAKVQALSLNPAKISGSCGRLMCCLRYEQEAYEDLIRKVPRQGAFVQTKDGYGTAVQVDLLRQTVQVRLDGDGEDSLHVYKSNELAAVPGGRPKEGEPLPSVLHYVPPEPEEEEEPVDDWAIPEMVVPDPEPEKPREENREGRRSGRRQKGGRQVKPRPETPAQAQAQTQTDRPAVKAKVQEVKPEQSAAPVKDRQKKNRQKGGAKPAAKADSTVKVRPPEKESAKAPAQAKLPRRRGYYRNRRKTSGSDGGMQ